MSTLIFLCACIRSAACQQSIRVAIDSRIVFGYTGITSRLSNSGLFTFRVTDLKNENDSFFHDAVDLVLLDRPLLYYTYFSNLGDPKPDSFATAPLEVLRLWDNKLFFKQWLQRIGLGAFTPHTMQGGNISFPCILKIVGVSAKKDHITSGKAVFLIKGPQQLNDTVQMHVTRFNIHKSPASKRQFFLEEPLVGQFEGTVYSSAYEGELLSLRCMVRVTYAGLGNAQRVLDKTRFTMHATPCGDLVRKHTARMVKITSYSGAFCMNFKMNSSSAHPLYLEMNPRICGTHVRNSRLFMSTFLPLVFMIHKRKCLHHLMCPDWINNEGGILQWIVHVEWLISLFGCSAEGAVAWASSPAPRTAIKPTLHFNGSLKISSEWYFVNRDSKPLSVSEIFTFYRNESGSAPRVAVG